MSGAWHGVFCPRAARAAAEFEQVMVMVRQTMTDEAEIRALLERARMRYAGSVDSRTYPQFVRDEWSQGWVGSLV